MEPYEQERYIDYQVGNSYHYCSLHKGRVESYEHKGRCIHSGNFFLDIQKGKILQFEVVDVVETAGIVGNVVVSS